MRCPACGNDELEGVRFCGVCGHAFQSRAPGAGGPNPVVSFFKAHPFGAALGGGLLVGVLIVGGLVIFSNGGGPSKGSNATNLPDSTATALARVLTPAASATSTPRASPSATGAAPTATRPPATSTLPPPPVATVIPPTQAPPPPPPTQAPPPPPPTSTLLPPVPAQKTSSRVGLTLTGGHGAAHHVGEFLQLCYTSIPNQRIRLFDVQGSQVTILRDGTDDGTGECFYVTVTAPTGVDIVRIDALNPTTLAVLDYAQLAIIVLP
jgi:hypothetical protein